MRSTVPIRTWIAALLPQGTAYAIEAAVDFVQALARGFDCRLCQLARQVPRNVKARSNRQYLSRWLERPSWDPPTIYAALVSYLPYLVQRWPVVPILVDFTFLSDDHSVLEFAIPFQKRALPVLRLVRRGRGGEALYAQMIEEGLAWLERYLPGPRSSYLLVGDRGFSSHRFLKRLQRQNWRYTFRISVHWRMAHPEFRGLIGEATGTLLAPGMKARWFGAVTLGQRDKGAEDWSESHVVWWWDARHREPWILVTSEPTARRALRAYRRRFGIECGFRDVKRGRKGRKGENKRVKRGHGISWLMEWKSAERVARFLVWVAVYEWWLAFLWLQERLHTWGRSLQVGGRLSWMRVTEEWVRRQLHQLLELPANLPARASPDDYRSRKRELVFCESP